MSAAAFTDILISIHNNDGRDPCELCLQYVTQFPESQLLSYLKKYVETKGENDCLYDAGNVFSLFISGFQNPQLYEAVQKTLCEQYESTNARAEQLTILDIGPGDGIACVGALRLFLNKYPKTKVLLKLVEPSKELLTKCIESVKDLQSNYPSLTFESYNVKIQEFVSKKNDLMVDFIQSSFALHNISSEERKSVFQFCKESTKNILIFEFDVNLENNTSLSQLGNIAIDKKYAHFVYERFENGLHEFQDGGFHNLSEANSSRVDELREMVILKFLMPIMVGYFAVSAANKTFEQPAMNWMKELCDFNQPEKSTVFEYWWSDCFLLKATA